MLATNFLSGRTFRIGPSMQEWTGFLPSGRAPHGRDLMRVHQGFALGVAICTLAGASIASSAQLDTPTLSKVDATRASITITLAAGATGAPAGFEIQWMSQAAYISLGNQWPADPYYAGLYHCDMDGVPTLHLELNTPSFLLGSNGTATFEMGSIFDETGLYADYSNELSEGTGYVFRAVAVSDGVSDDSQFSPTLIASTDPRGANDCTLTQGFWKTHGPAGCASGNNADAWMEASWPVGVPTVSTGCPAGAQPVLTLGTVNYCAAQICAILNTPASGNGLIFLAHQLIAAKLNVIMGATPPPSIVTAISNADALIGSLVVPPVGSGFLSPGSASSLTNTLDDFNNGTTGPGACPGTTPTRSATWGRIKAIYR
jgi:hypothetical protein